MYQPVKVHVPKKVHEKLKNLVVKDKVVPVKIDLEHYGDDVLLLTPGQIIKMRNAKMKEKNRWFYDLVKSRYELMLCMKVDFFPLSCP